MRASFAVVAALIGAAFAQDVSTVYSTQTLTTTTCGPEVTNCPVSSAYTNSTIPVAPVSTEPASISVITISTCIPTTILSTITVTPTSTVPVSIVAVSTVPVSAVGSTGLPLPTTSAVISPSITPFTGSASSVSGSMVVAGLAAMAAVFMV